MESCWWYSVGWNSCLKPRSSCFKSSWKERDRWPHLREVELRNPGNTVLRSRILEFFACKFRTRASESGITGNDWNLEFKFHWQGIRNPIHGIQDPRLSWITLHGVAWFSDVPRFFRGPFRFPPSPVWYTLCEVLFMTSEPSSIFTNQSACTIFWEVWNVWNVISHTLSQIKMAMWTMCKVSIEPCKTGLFTFPCFISYARCDWLFIY